jgi:hypothetical protein
VTAVDDRLAALVRRVRSGLWLREIARAGKAGLWIAAGVLVGGALARFRFGMPTPAALAALATVPLALGLAVGLARRPPWAAALAATDRRAGADALLLTACGLPAAATGTAALVLAQALRALPAWEYRVWRYPDRAGVPLLPLGIMLAATPLLALQPSASPSPAPTPIRVTHPPEAPGEPLAQVIEQFRPAALAGARPPASEPTAAGRRAAGGPGTLAMKSTGAAAQPGELAPGGRPAGQTTPAHEPAGPMPEAEAVGRRLAGTTGAGGAGRDAAGTGARGPAGQRADRRADLAEHAVAIARRELGDAAAAAPGTTLDAVAERTADTSGNAPPATAPEPGAAQPAAFGIAQRQLIARYFALLGKEER